MNLNTSEWKEFLLPKIFSMVRGTRLTTYDRVTGNIPLVTAGEDNSGVSEYIGNIEQEKFYDTITIDMFGNCFYHRGIFCADDNILVLKNDDISMYAKLFISSVVNQDKYRYSYGRQYRQKNYIEHYIKLPIQYNPDGSPLLDNTYKYSEQGYVPDWQFMENYIKSLHYKPLTTKRVNKKKMELNVTQWEDFIFDDIFNIIHGTRLTKEDMEDGNTPFIGAIDNNNGVREYIGQAPLCNKNCVTVNYNGSVGEAFYQNRDFWASDDVNSLYAKGWQMNPQIGLFLATVIKADKYRYTYGRKWNAEKMRISVIKLPIQRNADGSPVIDEEKKYHNKGYIPDWQFMEDYINSLPYSDRII